MAMRCAQCGFAHPDPDTDSAAPSTRIDSDDVRPWGLELRWWVDQFFNTETFHYSGWKWRAEQTSRWERG